MGISSSIGVGLLGIVVVVGWKLFSLKPMGLL